MVKLLYMCEFASLYIDRYIHMYVYNKNKFNLKYKLQMSINLENIFTLYKAYNYV